MKKKAKKLPAWPGPKTKPLYRKTGNRVMREGEPHVFELSNFNNDRTLRAEEFEYCCDCGLRHFKTYEVFRNVDGFYLVSRTWRDPKTGKKR
jgi:hypothetical protein